MYYKRAPGTFRASVARGLFVLAGYAARPRRPRPGLVFGRCLGFLKAPPFSHQLEKETASSDLTLEPSSSCFRFGFVRSDTGAPGLLFSFCFYFLPGVAGPYGGSSLVSLAEPSI